MESRSADMYGKAHEGSEKFDYFVCGISGALFAYIGQQYTPHKIEFSLSLLEPLSLVFLLLSFYAGLKRIETVNKCTMVNHKILEAAESARNLADQLREAGESFCDPADGRVIGRIEMDRLRRRQVEISREWAARLAPVKRKALLEYRSRNRWLILGFSAIFLSKLAQPYSTEAAIPKPLPEYQLVPARTAPPK